MHFLESVFNVSSEEYMEKEIPMYKIENKLKEIEKKLTQREFYKYRRINHNWITYK